MKLSVALMAHPSRKPFVDDLLARLDREVPVVWDRRNDRWDTGRRSLLAHDPEADWHLVIQDDMIPCLDLIAGIERACDAATALGHQGPLGFYVGRLKPEDVQSRVGEMVTRAHHAGASWIATEGPWWGPAIALPTRHIPDAVEFGDERGDVANYDKKISRYYASRRIACWYSVPSLVDHRPVAENPSLVPGRHGNRQAHLFVGADRSALDITWTPPWQGDHPSMPTYRNRKTGNTLPAKAGSALAGVLDRHDDWEPVTPRQISTAAGATVEKAAEPVATAADGSADPALDGVEAITVVEIPTSAPEPIDFGPLGKLSRDELNEKATAAGVESPERYPNKDAVIAAIREKVAEPVA